MNVPVVVLVGLEHRVEAGAGLDARRQPDLVPPDRYW
jgi:hypothetical protein